MICYYKIYFYLTLNTATTLTCTYTSGNVVAGKTIIFTCNGTDSTEKQLNVNKLQTWWTNLMSKSDFANQLGKVYVMNLGTIIADAGLLFTGATTSPLTTTVVA